MSFFKGLFSRTRMFLLTDGPDLWYVEPDHLVLKGKVPFTRQMKTEIINFGLFFIHTVGSFIDFSFGISLVQLS